MFTFKNTAFLASLVTCGVILCSTAYYAQSTAIGSGLLSDKQLSEIYGGSEIDCEETDHVEGCAHPGDGGPVFNNAIAIDWVPPEYDPDDREGSSIAYLESIPKCPANIKLDKTGGPSAIGEDKIYVKEVDCHFSRPYSRSIVQNAVADGDFGKKTECRTDEDATTFCALCTLEGEEKGESEKAYKCPDDNGG